MCGVPLIRLAEGTGPKADCGMNENQMVAKDSRLSALQLSFFAVLLLASALWLTTARAATSEESAAAIASLNAGTAAIQAGRALEAIDYFNAAIEANALTAEGAALAYHHRGIAHQKLGLAGHAVADYTNAIWQGGLPDVVLPRSYYNRAVAYAAMGQQDRAEKDYDKAIELAPDYAAAYHNRGNLRRHLGNHTASIEDYTRALQLGMGGQEHLTFFARALSYNALGNRSSSLDDAARALELKPDFDTARKALAEWGGAATTNVAAAAPQQRAPIAITPSDPIVTASIDAPDQASSDNAPPTVSAPLTETAPRATHQVEARTLPAAPAVSATPASSASLDAVRIPVAGSRGSAPVRLSPPNVAAIEPQSGSVTVTPLDQALPAARASTSVGRTGADGWQTTVTRFAPPVSTEVRTSSGRAAAVPAETGLTTASIDRNSTVPATARPDLTSPRVSNRQPAPVSAPIRIAQNDAASTNDAGGVRARADQRVQVGSFRSAAEATTAWDRIANAHRALIGQKQPYIVEADLGARGTFYRLQIGPLGSSQEVKALCRALKLQGQDCIPAL